MFNSILDTSKHGNDEREDRTEEHTEATAGNGRKLVWYIFRVSEWEIRENGGGQYLEKLGLRVSNDDKRQLNSVLGNPVNPKDK